MITNKGKSLVAKYMLGQIPAFSSYLSIGCGGNPYSGKPTEYSISGSTVTVTFGYTHRFLANDTIYVSLGDTRVDGAKTIATAGSTTITFPANITLPALTAVDDSNPAVGSALYTAASDHYLISGDKVTTTGFTDADFNNTDATVTSVPSSTTFVIAEAGTGTTSSGTLSTVKITTIDSSATIYRYTLDVSTRRGLKFEMARIPITSRGLAVENGVDVLVFGAELPTQDRFSITEIGLFTAGNNNIITGSDSRIMHTFSNFENWEYHTTTTATAITNFTGTVAPLGGANLNDLGTTTFLSASDPVFNNANRTDMQEKPRMYDSTLLLKGNLSNITGMSSGVGSMAIGSGTGANHVHLLGQIYNFASNSSSDEIRLAFSVIYDDMATIVNPDYVGIIIEFSSEGGTGDPKYARMKVLKTSTDLAKTHYFVENVSLANLDVSANFSWDSVDAIKIYCDIELSGSSSGNYYVALDGIRFENIYDEDQNPAYGMVGYAETRSTRSIGSPTPTVYGIPIEKETNRSGLIEFKLPIIVGEV